MDFIRKTYLTHDQNPHVHFSSLRAPQKLEIPV